MNGHDRNAAPFRLAVFAVAWSAYGLIEMTASSWVWMGRGHSMLIAGATGVACLAVLQNPRSMLRLVALGVFFGAFHASMLPRVWNHAWLSLFANGALVLTACEAWLTTRKSPDQLAPAFFQRFVPTARWMVLILYFFSVLHKLNYDYFDPAVSCGRTFYQQIAEWLVVFPKEGWTAWPVIAASILIELFILILLLIPRLTRFGIALGVGFHFLIALHPDTRLILPGFSAAMLALYTLFLTPSQTGALENRVRSRLARVDRRIMWATVLAALVMVGLDVILTVRSSTQDFEPALDGVRWVCIAWYATAGSALVWAGFAHHDQDVHRALDGLRPRRIVGVLLALTLLLNGFAPYLGLRNEQTFSMFSNLRTEGADWNHFFIPSTLKLWDNQDDLVVILETTDPRLRMFKEREEQINFVELRRLAAMHNTTSFSVTYLRGGTRHRVDRSLDPDHEIFQPLRGLSRWFEWYRPVDPEGRPTRCRH